MDNNGYVPDEQNDENGTTFAITRYPSGNILSSADLVKINSRSALLRSPTFYKKILLIFLFFLVVLLIGLIVLACLYSREKKLHRLCESNECLKSASNLRLSMDTSVDPCDDFYKFSCGHWSDEHPNHGWYPKFSNFESIDERITLAVLKLLQENSSAIDPLPIRQSREFYQSCMDVDSRNSLGFSSIFKYLTETNLPIVPNYLNSTKEDEESFQFDWIKTDVSIKKVFFMDVLIGATVTADDTNRKQNNIYLGYPGQFSPLPSSHGVKQNLFTSLTNEEVDDNNTTSNKSEEEERKEQARQKNIMMFVIKTVMANVSLTLDNKTLENAANIILNVTEAIENIVDELDLNYTKTHYVRFNIDAIQNMTDEYLISNNESTFEMWRPYLNYLFENTSVTLDLDKQDFVHVSVPFETEYLKRVALYLVQTPDIYIELYMWWITVYTMIVHTTTDVSSFMSKQRTRKFSSNVVSSRSRHCSSIVKDFMGMAVSYGIADKTFLRKGKPRVEELLNEIKEAFIERLRDIDWMDQRTKQKTLDKCKEMISFIGFPTWLFKRGAIESYYYGVKIDKKKFLENMMEIIKMYMPYRLETLRKENLKSWTTDPIEVNAYNLYTDNSITVPLAILSFPMYHLGLEVLNYGAIGTILGHELTHGFDTIGRKFDKYGNHINWWSNETINAFEEKTKCFIQQYDNYTYPDVEEHILGERTLPENLADNGGLHHAFRAYQKYLKKYGEEPHLPGFENYTTEQLFFIAFANIWCESTTPDLVQFQISADVHAPNMIRVLGTLQNSKEFANAFNCPIDSNMNPFRPRCRIW